MGLGHNRRNRLIAQTLIYSQLQADILMIAGVPEQDLLPMSSRIDYLTLPSLYKEVDGQYRARNLNISLQDLLDLRAKTIRGALKAFKPDVFIVDNVPRGALRELEPTLKYLHKHKHTHCVLGLRDVLDDPAIVRHEWGRAENEDAIRQYYDAVWVYGDPTVYDPVREYRFSPDVAAKVRYVGYLDQSERLKFVESERADPLAALNLPPGKLVLCLVGGGQDGASLAEAFSQAVLPPDTNGIIITGPFMSPEVKQHLHYRAATNPRLQVLNFVKEPTLLLSRADRVIAMGGYNTICEILSFEKHALIVPRVQPRREQLIRAKRLQNLGLIDMLHPDNLNPSALSEWLSRDLGSPPRIRERVDLNGLSRLPYLLEEVVNPSFYPAQHTL
jgi:predicted glycosyltransferase